MGKLDGKVAVITGGTSGMALAGARLFVDEGAHVFVSGRRKDALDEAVKLIGRNVTGVQADSADLDDLDRLFETVKQEKGTVDVLWVSAGAGEQGSLGEITEEQFDAAFSPNGVHAVHGAEGATAVQRWGLDLHDAGRMLRYGATPNGACMQRARPCCPPTHGCGWRS